jgi:general L-amino acid transport system permease protein
LVRVPPAVGGIVLFVGVVSFGEIPLPWTLGFLGAAGVLGAVWAGARRWAAHHPHRRDVPEVGVWGAAVVAVVAALWTVPFGRYGYTDLQFIAEPGRTIALSTKLPWTVLGGILFASYWVGRWLRERIPDAAARRALLVAWLLSVPVIPLVIMRAPDLGEWDVGGDLLVLAAAAVGGGLVLLLITDPAGGDGPPLLAAAALTGYAFWPVSMPMVVRLLALLLAGFVLGSASFVGLGRNRLRYVATWAGATIPVIFLVSMSRAGSTIGFQSTSFLGGLALTLVLAVAGIVLSFPIGLLMALGRTSTMPVFRIVTSLYVDAVRGMPFLIVLIFADRLLGLLLPASLSPDAIMLAVVAITLYFSAYMAENIRGGLQSIALGQYEASRALGLSPFHITAFVVLPQALRAVVPALVGQAITIFKETTIVSVVVIWDFLFIGSKVVAQQSAFIGSLRENLLFAALVYWLFTFAMSRAGLRVERKLGLGEESHYGAL